MYEHIMPRRIITIQGSDKFSLKGLSGAEKTGRRDGDLNRFRCMTPSRKTTFSVGPFLYDVAPNTPFSITSLPRAPMQSWCSKLPAQSSLSCRLSEKVQIWALDADDPLLSVLVAQFGPLYRAASRFLPQGNRQGHHSDTRPFCPAQEVANGGIQTS